MNPTIHTAQVLPARAVLFLGIVAFHALLAYFLASGLLTTTISVLLPPSTIDVVPVKRDPPPADPPQSTPAPILRTAELDPLPDDLPSINLPPDSNAIRLSIEPPPETGLALHDPPPLPIRLVGRNVMPSSEDYYPPGDIRAGNEGTAGIRSCVDTNGKLSGMPTVETSSGHASLDRAAVRLARDGQYARAMQGDTPVPNCYRFRVTFTIH